MQRRGFFVIIIIMNNALVYICVYVCEPVYLRLGKLHAGSGNLLERKEKNKKGNNLLGRHAGLRLGEVGCGPHT